MPCLKLLQHRVSRLPNQGYGLSQCIYWDTQLPGFGVRVYASGRRTYVCSYRVLRRKRLASLGRADVLTLDEARRKAKRYFGLVAEQIDPQARTETLRAEVTINILVEEYLRRHAQVKKKTWRHDQSVLRRLLVPKCGTHRVGLITSAFLQAVHSKKGARTPVEANTFIKIVRKMFNLGRTAGLVPTQQLNPAAGIVPFPVKKRRRYLTPAEMPRFLAALEAEENEYARHAIWLLLLTGLRLNEILQAKWTDVDWDFRTLFIGLTKNGEPLLTPLGQAACERLRLIPRRADNPYVICGTRAGAPLVNLRKAWRRICQAADLHDLRLHDLRRTGLTGSRQLSRSWPKSIVVEKKSSSSSALLSWPA